MLATERGPGSEIEGARGIHCRWHGGLDTEGVVRWSVPPRWPAHQKNRQSEKNQDSKGGEAPVWSNRINHRNIGDENTKNERLIERIRPREDVM